jgi:hypothetical protein
MSVKLEDNIYLHFGTTSPSTGAATNADSTPTVTVEEEGIAMGYAPTVSNVAAGLYRVTIVCTTANGFEAAKRYSVYVTATVGGITGRDGIAEFAVHDADIDSVSDDISTVLSILSGAPAGIVAALQESIVEGSITFLEAMVILLDTAAADTTGFPGSPIIKSLDGTKNRIVASLDVNRNRTIVSRDLS